MGTGVTEMVDGIGTGTLLALLEDTLGLGEASITGSALTSFATLEAVPVESMAIVGESTVRAGRVPVGA